MMRVVFIGASHWHLDLYMVPFLDVPNVELVGISDPNPAVVRTLSERYNCAGDVDYKKLCRQVKPDFVFALGRHADMPDEAEFLIAERIPFALEKPCGRTQREVAAIAEAAERAGCFAAVPLVFRNGDFTEYLVAQKDVEEFDYMSFRFIAGLPQRYRSAGCDWMLDPALSGGGATINLGVHFFDLCRMLMGPEVRVHSAIMANKAWGEAVEDYAQITLEKDGALGVIEVGYLYPAPTSSFDMHYAFRSPNNYLIAHDPETFESLDNDGNSKTWKSVTTNVPHYRTFVFDVLERARTGKQPLATLSDMVPLMGLIEDAYSKANRQAFHATSHKDTTPNDQH